MPDQFDDLVKAGKPVKVEDFYRSLVSVHPEASAYPPLKVVQLALQQRPELQQIQFETPEGFGADWNPNTPAQPSPVARSIAASPPAPAKPSIWNSIQKGLAEGEVVARRADKTIQDAGLSLMEKAGLLGKNTGMSADQLRKIYATRGPNKYEQKVAALPKSQGILQNVAEAVPAVVGSALPYIAASEAGGIPGMMALGGLEGAQGGNISGQKGLSGAAAGAVENLMLAMFPKTPGMKSLAKGLTKSVGATLEKFGSKEVAENVARWVESTVKDINARGVGRAGTGVAVTSASLLPAVTKAISTGDWSGIPQDVTRSLATGLGFGLTARSNKGPAPPLTGNTTPAGGSPPSPPSPPVPDAPGVRTGGGPAGPDEVPVKPNPILPAVPGFPEFPRGGDPIGALEIEKRLSNATERQTHYKQLQQDAIKGFDEAQAELRKREAALAAYENGSAAPNDKNVAEKKLAIAEQQKHLDAFRPRLDAMQKQVTSVASEIQSLQKFAVGAKIPAARRAKAQGVDPNPNPANATSPPSGPSSPAQPWSPDPPRLKKPAPPKTPAPAGPVQLPSFPGFFSMRQGHQYLAKDIPGFDPAAHGFDLDAPFTVVAVPGRNLKAASAAVFESGGKKVIIPIQTVDGKAKAVGAKVVGGQAKTADIPQNPVSQPATQPPSPTAPPSPTPSPATPPSVQTPTTPPVPSTPQAPPVTGGAPSATTPPLPAPPPAPAPTPEGPSSAATPEASVPPSLPPAPSGTAQPPSRPSLLDDIANEQEGPSTTASPAAPATVPAPAEVVTDPEAHYAALAQTPTFEAERARYAQEKHLLTKRDLQTIRKGGREDRDIEMHMREWVKDQPPPGDQPPPVEPSPDGTPSAPSTPPPTIPSGPTPPAVAQPSAPVAAAEPPQQQPDSLPLDLRGAKPRYSYGAKQFTLEFENDADKAAYIAAQESPSARDAEYVKFASDRLGISPDQVRLHGAAIKESIKQQAKAAIPGNLKVPKQQKTPPTADELRAKFGIVKPTVPVTSATAPPLTPEAAGQKLAPQVRQQAMESAGKGVRQPQPAAVASESGQPPSSPQTTAAVSADHRNTTAKLIAHAKTQKSKYATIIVHSQDGKILTQRSFNPQNIQGQAAVDEIASVLQAAGAHDATVVWSEPGGKTAKIQTRIGPVDPKEMANINKKSGIDKPPEPPPSEEGPADPEVLYREAAQKLYPGKDVDDLTDEEEDAVADEVAAAIKRKKKP